MKIFSKLEKYRSKEDGIRKIHVSHRSFTTTCITSRISHIIDGCRFSTYKIMHHKLPGDYQICCLDLLRTKAIIPQLLEVTGWQLSAESISRHCLQCLSWGPPTSNNWSVGQWTLCLNLEQLLSSIPVPELLTESAEALCNKCIHSSTFLSAQFCFPCFPQAWIPQVLP